MKKFGSWFKNLSIAKKVIFGVVALFVISAAASGGNSKTPLTSTNTADVSKTNHSTTASQLKAPTVTTKNETETQAIPFSSTTVNDSTLATGQTKVTTTGVNGAETLTYQITYTNGQQTSRKLISTVVNIQPVTQVTSVGTYVAPTPALAQDCPNGTYVNSDGNTVCNPYASTTAPAGATAQCVDGTYSFSQHHSGTCSGHGGVAQWL